MEIHSSTLQSTARGTLHTVGGSPRVFENYECVFKNILQFHECQYVRSLKCRTDDYMRQTVASKHQSHIGKTDTPIEAAFRSECVCIVSVTLVSLHHNCAHLSSNITHSTKMQNVIASYTSHASHFLFCVGTRAHFLSSLTGLTGVNNTWLNTGNRSAFSGMI